MTSIRLLQLVLAAALAVVFWVAVRAVGRVILRLGGWTCGDPESAETVLGLGSFAAIGGALGAVGWLSWPVVAGIVLVPGLAGCVHIVATRRDRALWTWLDGASVFDRAVGAGLLLIAAVYVVLASAPAVHYDLMVNYLAVPKSYLVSGSVAPLPENVFSLLSFGLHAMLIGPLALSELVDRSEFLFGGAEVAGFANVAAVAVAGAAAVRLGSRVCSGLPTAGRAAAAAVLLWACMPQNLLVVALELPDPWVTCLTMLAAASLVASIDDGGAGDALACGVACGLLVAAKPQAAVPAIVAGGWWIARLSRDRSSLAFLAGGIVGWGPAAVRSWVSLGSPLAPYVGGQRSLALGHLLAENAVSLPSGPLELGARIVDVATLYPEVGLVPLGVLGLLLARPRSWIVLAMAAAPVVLLCVVSGSAHNVLRWLQAPLLLLLVLAGEGMAGVALRMPVARAFPLVLAVGSLVIGLPWIDATVGAWRGLRSADDVVGDTISAFDTRRETVRESTGRMLWIGEVQGYWGARNGTFPTVRDGRFLGSVLDMDEPVRRLREAGYTTIVRSRLREDMLEEQGFWADVGPTPEAARRRLGALLSRLPARRSEPGVEVYDLRPVGQ